MGLLPLWRGLGLSTQVEVARVLYERGRGCLLDKLLLLYPEENSLPDQALGSLREVICTSKLKITAACVLFA